MSEIVALAGAISAALCAAIAKLWLDNVQLRREAAAERERAQVLEERLNKDHKRDLRWALGMPTSLDPPPPQQPQITFVRDERPQPPRPRKSPRK